MSALVTDICQQLRDSLAADIPPGRTDAFLLPATYTVSDFPLIEIDRLSTYADLQVIVGARQRNVIGEAGPLTNHEILATVHILQRLDNTSPVSVDKLDEFAQQVEAACRVWQNEKAYTVSVQQVPMRDEQQRHTNNLFLSQLLLTIEAVTGWTSPEQPTFDDESLTAERFAAWEAIENWPALNDLFERTYKTDLDQCELSLREPGRHELPALSLKWSQVRPEWHTQRMMRWPATVEIEMWFPPEQRDEAETAAREVVYALHSATSAGSTVPVVKRRTGFHPRAISDLSQAVRPLGRSETHMVNAMRWQVVLESRMDPFDFQ